MNRMDYVQGVVRTRVLEKELLSQTKIEQMIEADDMSHVWAILKTTQYAKYLQDHQQFDEYEAILKEVLIDEFGMIRDIAVDPHVIELLTLKYDFHNIKVLFKETLLKIDLSHLLSPLSTHSIDQLKSMIQDDQVNVSDENIQLIIHKVKTKFEQTKDPQQMEIILDRLYVNELYERIKQLNMPLLLQYVKAMIDFINIRTVIRIQKQQKDMPFLQDVLLKNGNIDCEKIAYSLHDSVINMIRQYENEEIGKVLVKGLQSYEETDRLTTLEKEMDNCLMSIINEAKYIHFGPEPLIAYLIKKEAEIKNLRMIFVSKLNNISSETIKQRMRDIYV